MLQQTSNFLSWVFLIRCSSSFYGTFIYALDIFNKMASPCGNRCSEATSHEPDLFLFSWFDNIFTVWKTLFNLAKVTFLLFPCTNKKRNVISLCLTFPIELSRPFQIPFWIIKRKQTYCFLHCNTIFLYSYIEISGCII